MKITLKQRKVRGEIKWVLDVIHEGKRRRKFFNSKTEADRFDVLSWMGEVRKKEPVGDETILIVAKELYYNDYLENNFNPNKPKQKGYRTTVERVNKFLDWFGEDRPVHEVTVNDYKDYVMSGKWSEETKAGYSRAVRTFMAWCAKQNLGSNVTDWYFQTNPDLKIAKKKTYSKLPEIVTPEQAEGLLNEITDKYRPALALMLFAGIRPEIEMLTLDYSTIRWGKSIGLRAEHTKTGRERWIKPPENLWSWIPKKKVNIMPSYNSVNKARYRASKRLGFKYPPNGARHSFGSYGYWKSFEWALDTMGHMSSETFLKNYKNNRVDKELSDQYFGIVAEG
jgi:integrase